jgi:3',5'-cyclic AMP phosphodiesterase CpdA
MHLVGGLVMQKKRRWASIFILSVLSIASLFAMGGSEFWLSDAVYTGTSAEVTLTFSVLGDVHGNGNKLNNIVDDLYRLRPDLDVLILNGDTVDQGLDEQYKVISDMLDKNKAKLPDTVIKNIGNHELFDYEYGPNSPEHVKELIGRYLRFSGEENPYHDKWIKGYHFISMGTEDGNTPELGAVKAYIYEEQQRWLEKKLAENYKPGKPIFVFLHQHLNSVMSRWVGVEQKEEIIKILSEYPEVIVFTSHTHIDLAIDNVNIDQPFSTAHTGAIAYILRPDGKGGRERSDGMQGLYVEVNGDKVVINGRDFDKRNWIFSKEVMPKN